VAGSVATLFWVMLAGSAVLFLVVIVPLLAMIFKPGIAARVSPRQWIMHGGLTMPIVVLTVLVAYALFMGERLIAKPLADAPLRIEARAHQWYWEFAYPEGAAPPSESVLHMPAGVPVDFVVTASDVIHSFWIPQLGGKIDAIPGHENTIRLLADRPGTYQGICAEFCGLGHTEMRFTVEVHAMDAFEDMMAGGAADAPGEGADAE
jgi:cytochrome c oxidase subunit II